MVVTVSIIHLHVSIITQAILPALYPDTNHSSTIRKTTLHARCASHLHFSVVFIEVQTTWLHAQACSTSHLCFSSTLGPSPLRHSSSSFLESMSHWHINRLMDVSHQLLPRIRYARLQCCPCRHEHYGMFDFPASARN